ncbi:NAD(P)H-binding protein [Streptomyces sp. NPDC005322]|uniref:NAD(P)H-binding protein n=1 Tax=Streptomyces sp. NPDC005322 TaxID=3157032 RepID=UPI0033ADC5F9
MRIYVAGATGVIGRRLVPLLVAAGHQVTGAARTPEGAERLRAQGASAVGVDAFAAAVGAPAPAPVEGPGAGREGWERGADNTRARRLGWRPVHASWRTGFTTL